MGNKPIFCYVIFLANTVKQEAFLWYGHVERYWRDVKLYIRGGCCCWNILPVQVVTEIQLSFDSPRLSVLSCVSLKWPTWSAAANPTQGCQHLQRIPPRNEAFEQWGHGQWLCVHIPGQMVYDQILNLLLATCGNVGHQWNDSAHHLLHL